MTGETAASMANADPFFIIGFQRSGTTLIRMMLDSHPDVAIPLDTVGLWSRYAARLEEYGDLNVAADRDRLIADLLNEERIALWRMNASVSDVAGAIHKPGWPGIIDAMHCVYASSKGKTIWGDKDPGNMTRIDQLVSWFPGARFLHIIRDGRDACLSQLEQSFGFNDVLPCAVAWREEVTWVRRIGRILGAERYFEFRYEDLVRNPEPALQHICAFLGLPFDPSMLRYHERVADSIPDSKRHIWPLIGEPPRASNAEVWRSRMTPSTRTCFEKRAGPLLAELGYETLPGPASGAYLEELRQFAALALRALRRRQ
jgi:hypothetical protein